jgi:hypothetical protein
MARFLKSPALYGLVLVVFGGVLVWLALKLHHTQAELAAARELAAQESAAKMAALERVNQHLQQVFQDLRPTEERRTNLEPELAKRALQAAQAAHDAARKSGDAPP